MLQLTYKGPLTDISESKSSKLAGKKIALAITGSVASIKSPELARELMRHGAEIFPVFSEEATRIIGPDIMEWATGNSSITTLTGMSEHLTLAGDWNGKVDLILVAPATANTVGIIANGIDDTPVTTLISCAIGSSIPIAIAPAMHEPMYRNLFVQENLKKLKKSNLTIIPPLISDNKAKMAPIETIVISSIKLLTPQNMSNMNVLITAGPTAESIDPARIITNRSSGKMGLSLALDAYYRGANVSLICGFNPSLILDGMEINQVESNAEMLKSVESSLQKNNVDLFLSAAAVSDFTPMSFSQTKISSKSSSFNLALKSTPKIISIVKSLSPKTCVVAFKACTNLPSNLDKFTTSLFKSYNCDFIAINDVSRSDIGFNSDDNEIHLAHKTGDVSLIEKDSKINVSSKIFDIILDSSKIKSEKPIIKRKNNIPN